MRYVKKKRRRHLNIPFIIDLVMLLVLIGVSIFCLLKVSALGLLPNLYIVLLCLFSVVVCLIYAILALIKQNTLFRVIKSIFAVCLIIGSVVISSSVSIVDEAIDDVLEMPESYDEYVTIVARKDSGIVRVEDLVGKRIAVQRSVDTEHMELAMNELSKLGLNEEENFYYYEDYASAIKNLYDGYMSAMVVSENYREIIEENYDDFTELTSRIEAYVVTIPVTTITQDIDITSNAFTVMISGIDTVGKPTLRENSDSNMLVVVNPLSKTITMLSIPRDALMPNACLAYKDDKLTHTGRLGIDCTIKTLENYFDINIDYYARISFSSVIDVVNTLGGINVNVPMDFCERPANRSYEKKDIIYVKKGQQVLNGEKALALARHRKTVSNGDVGRAYNQQLVVNAMIKKVLQPSSFSKIDDLVQVVGDTVQTNFTKKEIYSFVNAFIENPTDWTLSNNVVAGLTGFSEVATIPGREVSIINLSDEEVNRVKYIIKNAQSMDLSELTFTINDLETSSNEVTSEGETEGATGSDSCHLD